MSVASRLAVALAGRVQHWSFARAHARGAALGRLVYRIDRRHREIALRNLRMAFPESDERWRRQTARACFAQLGQTALELLWGPRLCEQDPTTVAEPMGLENLHEALAQGRGVLIATAHYGSWELMGLYLARLGIPLVSVARPLDDPELDQVLLRLRTATGARIVPKQGALRAILRSLRTGAAVAILTDQNTLRHEAVFVPYFGRLAATTPVLAHLHLRTGAPIVPVFTVPREHRYRLLVEPPLRMPRLDKSQRIEAITAAVTTRIEHHVRQCPAAWLWMHDRWRERP